MVRCQRSFDFRHFKSALSRSVQTGQNFQCTGFQLLRHQKTRALRNQKQREKKNAGWKDFDPKHPAPRLIAKPPHLE
jgi:hypothetical protein